jgi:hypothetical protein
MAQILESGINRIMRTNGLARWRCREKRVFAGNFMIKFVHVD